MDIPPHPHIGLATVTYLLPGSVPLLHRDSLGTKQLIRPGEINVMFAGRGIVHSERRPEKGEDGFIEPNTADQVIHGLQFWMAHPVEKEGIDPFFEHHGKESLPAFADQGIQVKVLMGSLPGLGLRSTVTTLTPTFYSVVTLEAGAEFAVDLKALAQEGIEEVAAYAVDAPFSVSTSSLRGNGDSVPSNHLKILRSPLLAGAPLSTALLRGSPDRQTTIALFGGQKLDGHRHMVWNFIASEKSTIEEAKKDWNAFCQDVKAGRAVSSSNRFKTIPGDEGTFIPLL